MKFTPDVYRSASLEHTRAAFDLYSAGRYVLCFYVSGLAVECMLRSLKTIGAEFDEKHDLEKLAKSVGFFRRFPTNDSETQMRLTAAFTMVVFSWENRHRFRSAASMRKFLKHKQLDRRVKGDFVKENSRRIYVAAQSLVTFIHGEKLK